MEPQTADGGLREREPPPRESRSIARLLDDLSLTDLTVWSRKKRWMAGRLDGWMSPCMLFSGVESSTLDRHKHIVT